MSTPSEETLGLKSEETTGPPLGIVVQEATSNTATHIPTSFLTVVPRAELWRWTRLAFPHRYQVAVEAVRPAKNPAAFAESST